MNTSNENGRSKGENPLKKYLDDQDGLKFLLLTIQEIHEMGTQVQDNNHFVEIFLDKVGQTGLNRHEVGGIFASLSRNKYIDRFMRGSKFHGYVLARAGWDLIKDEMPAKAGAAAGGSAPSIAPVKDPAQVIMAFHFFAEQISEVGKRVAALKDREGTLVKELEQVRKEIVDLCPYANDPEMLVLMERLAAKQKMKPAGTPSPVGQPNGAQG